MNEANKAAGVERLSNKASKRPATTGKLHIASNATPLGLGAAAMARPNRIVAQGMRRIWNGISDQAADWPLPEKGVNSPTAIKPAQQLVLIREEVARAEGLTKLKKSFADLVKQDAATHITSSSLSSASSSLAYSSVPPTSPVICIVPTGNVPIMAFERWLFNAKLASAAMISSFLSSVPSPPVAEIMAVAASLDPLLPSFPPCLPAYADAALVADLQRAGHSESSSVRIAGELATQCTALAANIKIQEEGVTTGRVGKILPPVRVDMHKHTLDVSCGKHILLKLNREHHDKLLQMYQYINNDDDVKKIKNEKHDAKNIQSFNHALFIMLLRYHTVQGHGYQAACSEHVFAVLSSLFQIQMECFASPLNCYYPHFCSAFPDVDVPFGSFGSFFQLQPQIGSFHVNPPFVPHVMDAMVTHIEQCLHASVAATADGAGGKGSKGKTAVLPLSFIVVIPCWLEDPAFQRLCKSEFLDTTGMSATMVQRKGGCLLIARTDHGFCDGAQHQRRDRWRESPFDTAVFFLRNSAGKAKWPRTAETDQALRQAFAEGRPTQAITERRKREGRGFADLDGGGGIYRGKKKNKRDDNGAERGMGENRIGRTSLEKESRDSNSSSFGGRGRGGRGGKGGSPALKRPRTE